MSLGDDHIAKRVYIGLRDEKGRLGSGDIKNGVRGYLERLARDAGWGSLVLGKAAAKARAKKYVISEQRREFEVNLKERSTLAEYRKFTSTARRCLPKYLARICPVGLRHGRRLKTKFRLGVHQLQGCLARMIPGGVRTQAHSRCGCCSVGAEETIKHALFVCSAHRGIRAGFYMDVAAVCPRFGSMRLEERYRLLMSDDPPKEIDNLLYLFLIRVFASRERRLASGPAGSSG